MVSSLNDQYWRDRFDGARRIALDIIAPETQAAPVDAPE
jgi:hypothetical protein